MPVSTSRPTRLDPNSRSKTQAGRKRPGSNSSHTNTDIPVRSSKRALTIAPCNVWLGSKPFCRYCNADLSGASDESHLLYNCTGVPNSNPLPKSRRRFPKGLMKRLAEISAIPDPGGDIIGGT